MTWEESGQDGSFKLLKKKAGGCIRPSYGPFRSLNWREMYSRCPYSTPQSCAATHSHPQTSQAAIGAPDHSYGLSLSYRKAASKSRPLNCSLYSMWNWIVYSSTIVFMVNNQICYHGRYEQSQSHFMHIPKFVMITHIPARLGDT